MPEALFLTTNIGLKYHFNSCHQGKAAKKKLLAKH